MKAALALLLIYVGAFLVAIQGSSPVTAEAAPQSNSAKAITAAAIKDPVKEADIRALLELVGARDQIQDSVTQTAEQYREKLLLTVQNNEKGQAYVNTVISQYEKDFNVDQVTERLVVVYDKHYSDDEVKALLQFYGSPLGQKVAAESPKISRDMLETTRATASQAARDAIAQVRQENPGAAQTARLGTTPARRFQARHQQQSSEPNSTEQSAQQTDPQ